MTLESHLRDLLSSDAPSKSERSEWLAVLKEWETSQTANSAHHDIELDNRDEALLSQASPWPALLDYYSQPPKVGQSSRTQTLPTSPPQASRSLPRSNVDVSKLKGRLQMQLPAPTQYLSLTTLLNSDRSSDDIQSELVEVLGFEGDGLALVEELLRPGVREAFLEDLHGGTRASTGPTPSHTVYARSGSKPKRKEKRINVTDIIGTNEDIERRLQEQLEGPRAMFVDEERWVPEQEQLPHVFTSTSNVPGLAMTQGGKFALPTGTERELNDTFEEVIIPPSRPMPPRATEKPVRVVDLPPLAKGCFPNYVSLNRMQSVVQPIAMNTNENMLVCAPTGAGKTDVAIMAIIRVFMQHLRPGLSSHPSGFSIDRDAFKVIYVAPMKALAAEITRKFGKRLAWLGIKVRELTGDMQLTRQEIAETQIIVTTPEKWDVVTRKPTGEGELASKVKLLIIDEVHLLNEERGAVIETIVARTLRQVESSQSLIRIVGLSATLPNYIDVSDFLRVNRYQGLFFFDASFRPVPLEQHFIGVTGKSRSQQSIRNMEQVVFDKVSELVQEGHQVMVFVHARKETVNTAKKLKEQAMEEGMTTFFETTDHPKHGIYRRDIGTSRNKEMKELFDAGFGIHHAGMLRSDRNMMERMFEDNAIKVLCCTSTLAWGVNLPAHAVVIKGTQVYDSTKGAFVDLSVLDVLQIFGRAGRPGYETSGVGYICTTHDKLDHYLQSIMSQHPIESKFIPGMIDSLNAEIALGTINSIQDAIQWLGYTYLFVRMRREPFIYGMAHDELKDDPQLGNKRNELITQAALQLANAKMARYDDHAHSFVISDLGRISAKYYLKYQTIDVFNEKFHARMRNADLFDMLSQATEFEQIQLRETEMPELTAILESEEYCPLEVKGGVSTKQGKVNILLQAHISKVFLEDFALVSDSAYVAQNAARIIRALLEIALSRNWANNAQLLIDLSKAIEQRMWPYDHPLQQVSTLQRDTLFNLRRHADDVEIPVLRDMEAKELGDMIHMNEAHGQAVKNAAQSLPMVEVSHALRPLSHDVLEVKVKVTPTFKWNARVSASAEPFYIWIQEETGIDILQWRSVLLRQTTTSVELDFVLSFEEGLPPLLKIVSASDRWLGSGDEYLVPLEGIRMPQEAPSRTQLQDVPFLNIRCLDDPSLQEMYSRYITTLNNIQTQAFWTLYHTNMNVLVSAPVTSGKSFLGEMAIWHAFRHNANATIMVLCPSRTAARETAARIQSVLPKSKPIKVHSLFSQADFEKTSSGTGTIAVTCPSSILSIDVDFAISLFRHLSLAIFEDLHLLDTDYELAAIRLLSIAKPNRARLVGLTCSLNDPTDLATWLGVEEVNRFHFIPTNRGAPIITSVRPFSIPHSATLMRVMVKPTYDILKSCLAGAIMFVPSRAACRSVASDLVTQSGNAMDINGFLKMPRADVEPLLQRVRDEGLYEPLLHGIGYITANMAPSDMALVLELFASGIVRALIAPREACWTLPVKGETVIVMGAQHVQMHDGERRVINYSRTELVKMQSFAITSALPLNASSQGSRMFVLCQGEQRESITRALAKGLPLESSIPDLLRKQSSPISQQSLLKISKPRPPPPRPQLHRPRAQDLRKRDMMDMLGWSYLSLRVKSNPTYYDVDAGHQEEGVSRIIDEWFLGDEYGPPTGLDPIKVKSDKKSHDNRGSSEGADVNENAVKEVEAEVGSEVPDGSGKVGEADGETADEPRM